MLLDNYLGEKSNDRTKHFWVIQYEMSNPKGWEDLGIYNTQREAKDDLKLYRENDMLFNTYRIIKRLVM